MVIAVMVEWIAASYFDFFDNDVVPWVGQADSLAARPTLLVATETRIAPY
jgi:hypothetical protein